MKKLLLPIIIILSAFPIAKGQISIDTLKANYLKNKLTDLVKETNEDTMMILTYKGLDRVLAKRLSFYLSGEENLSLFKNYTILNIADDRLFLGRNIRLNNTDNRLTSMLTLGIRANISKNFAKIIGKKEFENEIGASLRYTFFPSYSVWFNKANRRQTYHSQKALVPPPTSWEQKDIMNYERLKLLEAIYREIDKEVKEFDAYISSSTDKDYKNGINDSNYKRALIDQFYEDLVEAKMDKLAEKEAEFMAKNKLFNALASHWVSIYGYVPFTSTEYVTAADFVTAFETQMLYPFELKASYNYAREGTNRKSWPAKDIKQGVLFVFIEGGIRYSNSAANDLMQAIDKNTYRNLGGTDTVTFAQLETEKAYIGKYIEKSTSFLSGQLVFFPRGWKHVGFSVMLEQNFGYYNPSNARIGLPIKASGKKDDSPVNFELQVRAFDILGEIQPDKDVVEKLSVGISVGLPFGNKIY